MTSQLLAPSLAHSLKVEVIPLLIMLIVACFSAPQAVFELSDFSKINAMIYPS